MTVPKRQTLADFLSYSLCTGQRLAGPYGYSPLPLNLVKAAFGQLEKLGPAASGGAVKGVNIKNPSANLASCDNPTFVQGQPRRQPPGPDRAPAAGLPEGEQPAVRRRHAPARHQREQRHPHRQQQPEQRDTTATTAANNGNNSGTSDGTTPPGRDHRRPAATARRRARRALTAQSPLPASQPTATVLAAQSSSDSSIWGWTAVVELLAIVLLPGLYVAWLHRRRGAR